MLDPVKVEKCPQGITCHPTVTETQARFLGCVVHAAEAAMQKYAIPCSEARVLMAMLGQEMLVTNLYCIGPEESAGHDFSASNSNPT